MLSAVAFGLWVVAAGAAAQASHDALTALTAAKVMDLQQRLAQLELERQAAERARMLPDPRPVCPVRVIVADRDIDPDMAHPVRRDVDPDMSRPSGCAPDPQTVR